MASFTCESVSFDLLVQSVPCAILSPSYIDGSWTRYELDGLVISELDTGKTIIPIRHDLSKEDVIQFSPPIANKLAWDSSTMSIETIAAAIATRLAERSRR